MTGQTAGKKNGGLFRFERRFLWGLITGVLIAAILGGAVTLMAKPDLFGARATTESPAMVGGVLLPTSEVVTPQDFDAIVLKSSRQELVLILDTVERIPSLEDVVETIDMAWGGSGVKYYYATDAASRDYIGDLRAYTEEGPPILAMFYQGKVVAKKSLLTDAESLLVWMNQNRMPKPTPTTTTAPAPAPEPDAGPAFFRAFTTSVRGWFQPDAASDTYLSEVILAAADFDMTGFVKADRTITAPIDSNKALFSLIGNNFGGDSTQFVLPDLSGQVPVVGLHHQIAIAGVFPRQDAEDPAEAHTVGQIKYLGAPISNSGDLSDDLYIGQVVLIRDAGTHLDLSRALLPCDGRELQVTANPALFNVLGNRFGGDGRATFRVPDLSGSTPIAGARYFMVIQGLYPVRGDGLPKPTPTTQPATPPIVFRAFLSSMDDRIQPSAASDSYLGEVILSAADHAIPGFLDGNRATTLPIDGSALFPVIGNSFGGDSTTFVLPGLSGQLPNAKLTYQIHQSGAPVPKAEKSVRSQTIGDIKHVEASIRTLNDVDGRVYLGEIILAKGVDGVAGLSRNLVPCDGREMSRFMYPDLYSLVGTRFGGTPDKFRIPDLQNAAPIDGARYYFAVRGIVPGE